MTTTLLPPNRTDAEEALEATMARVGELSVGLADVWDPATCPLGLLPWLAWSVRVPVWDVDWPEETKRAAVAAAPELNRHLGTPWAVLTALTAAGFAPDSITEGFPEIVYDGAHLHDGSVDHAGLGQWARNRITFLIDGGVLSEAQLARVRSIFTATAPRRSALAEVDYFELASDSVGVSDVLPDVAQTNVHRYDAEFNYDGAITHAGGVTTELVWA